MLLRQFAIGCAVIVRWLSGYYEAHETIRVIGHDVAKDNRACNAARPSSFRDNLGKPSSVVA